MSSAQRHVRYLHHYLAAHLERWGTRLVWAGIRVLGWAQRLAPMPTTGQLIQRLLEACSESQDEPASKPTMRESTRVPWHREQ